MTVTTYSKERYNNGLKLVIEMVITRKETPTKRNNKLSSESALVQYPKYKAIKTTERYLAVNYKKPK